MGLLNFGLQKFAIYAYKKPERLIRADKIEAMYNPESYKRRYGNVFTKHQGIAIPGADVKYSCSRPDKLEIKLIFTDTGTESLGMVGLLSRKSVSERVKKFLNITTKVHGEMHRPYYLSIKWDKLAMDCNLASVDINYTMFGRSGKPLRAELDTVFQEDVPLKKAAQQASYQSPDVTRSMRVKAGDTLPLMAAEAYEDSSWYVKVAGANALDSVRKIRTGETVNFPPISG